MSAPAPSQQGRDRLPDGRGEGISSGGILPVGTARAKKYTQHTSIFGFRGEVPKLLNYSMCMIELLRYQPEDGREPFTEWLESVRDKMAQARIRIRLRQLEPGNYGDSVPVG